MLLSSELLMIMSRGWKRTHETLWPLIVSTSQAFVSFMRQSLICLSSAPEMIRGMVGWNEAQFTPRSWPSRTYLTTASFPPKRSLLIWGRRDVSSADEAFFFFKPEMSQTRMVWSSEAETIRSSLGWKNALMTWLCPVRTAWQVRDCQFQMRMVWSSEQLTIHGHSWWNWTVRMSRWFCSVKRQ
eukprot:27054_3